MNGEEKVCTLAVREENFHFMVSKQNWSQIIKHYGTYGEKRRCKPSECTSGLDGFQSIVSFSARGPCLVIQQSLGDEGNDNSGQCSVHSSVCFNIWRCRLDQRAREGCRLRGWGTPAAWLVGNGGGKCRPSFVPAARVGRALTISCAAFL